MVAARVLAYGPEYECEVINPNTEKKFNHTFNLGDCPFKKISDDVEGNKFEMELPASKVKITFKLITGKEEKLIESELKNIKKPITGRYRLDILKLNLLKIHFNIHSFI